MLGLICSTHFLSMCLFLPCFVSFVQLIFYLCVCPCYVIGKSFVKLILHLRFCLSQSFYVLLNNPFSICISVSSHVVFVLFLSFSIYASVQDMLLCSSHFLSMFLFETCYKSFVRVIFCRLYHPIPSFGKLRQIDKK